MSNAHARMARAAVIASLAALAVSACRGGPSQGAGAAAGAPATRASATGAVASALVAQAPAVEACVATDAHARHAAQGYACAVCHTCGGALGFSTVTFPGGSTSANGTVSPAGPATTCLVGCHAPLGAPAQPVAWNAGPLACASCHGDVAQAAPVRSSHLASVPAASACDACHELSRHTSGEIRP
jgi:hypothetical protein